MSATKIIPEFSPAGFFVFRTPVLSFDEFLEWGHSARVAESHEASFEQSYAEVCSLLRERLYELTTVPETREAIFIACPDLIGFIEDWRSKPETKRGRNTERALVRYFSRMTGRPTPFGLFAGTSVGLIGDGTRLATEGRDKFRRLTRLDFDYLVRISEEVALSPQLRKDLIYRPNSSLYRAGGRIRYLESRRKGQELSYQLISLEETNYLIATLELAREGRKPRSLAKALVNRNITSSEAEKYINLLIDNQILEPEFSVPITVTDPLASLMDQLRGHGETRAVTKILRRTRSELRRIDRDGLGIDLNRYQAVAQSLDHLPARADPSHLFHVELIKPARTAVLGGEVLDEIIRGVSLLRRITPRPAVDPLMGFRNAFAERYEEREVPLAEALDEESGIGFPATVERLASVAGLEFPSQPKAKTWDSRQEFLLQTISGALKQGKEEIALCSEDIEKLEVQDPLPLANSFAAVVKVAAVSQAALDRGEFRVLIEGVSGPSGAELFGRSCHADKMLRRHVSRYVRAERLPHPNAVFAEIVHLPEGRAGNIVTRPELRDFEIPYLGRSGARAEKQIPVSDLRVSARGEHIYLRSTTLGKEVIPRLTNAHYSQLAPPVYRFLSSLQYQGVAGELTWTWGVLSHAPFLPRVVCGRLVLSPARWFVTREELQELDHDRPASRFKAIQAWSSRRDIPSVTFLSDGDNSLPVDLENPLSAESFAMLLRRGDSATLVESFSAHGSVTCAPEPGYLHHLVVPFMESRKETKRAPQVMKVSERNANQKFSRRTFPPGSEYVYAKLYSGTETTDTVLQNMIPTLVQLATKQGLIDGWFFVRYGDPEWHLRLRFHLKRRQLNAEFLPLLHAAVEKLMKTKLVWRFQLDTYEREVERYGGDQGIVLAEKLFHADSEMALAIIEKLGRTEDDESMRRWQLALYGTDRLLTDFGFDLKGRAHLVRRCRDAYASEQVLDKKFDGQLSEKFRKERRTLSQMLEADPQSDNCLKLVQTRSQTISPIISKLQSSAQEGSLEVSFEDFVLSCIHMNVNRILLSAHREHEVVIYDFLARIYESRIAQARSK